MTDGRALFASMHPGFFERFAPDGDESVYEEMILGLAGYAHAAKDMEGVTFGLYEGDIAPLLQSVREVDEDWAQYYTPESSVYCAMADGRVVSFCLLDDMGEHEVDGRMARIAGPGCVGTIPAYRRRGVGLEMVARGTQILRERGYDYSYIHYTGVAPWYAKLGYRTILRWNKRGETEEA